MAGDFYVHRRVVGIAFSVCSAVAVPARVWHRARLWVDGLEGLNFVVLSAAGVSGSASLGRVGVPWPLQDENKPGDFGTPLERIFGNRLSGLVSRSNWRRGW